MEGHAISDEEDEEEEEEDNGNDDEIGTDVEDECIPSLTAADGSVGCCASLIGCVVSPESTFTVTGNCKSSGYVDSCSACSFRSFLIRAFRIAFRFFRFIDDSRGAPPPTSEFFLSILFFRESRRAAGRAGGRGLGDERSWAASEKKVV